MEQKILAYLKEHETEIFEDLKTLVLTEASTSDIEALAKVREKLVTADQGAHRRGLLCLRGGETDTVRCASSMERRTEKILFIGHYDTVHLIGALKYYTEGNGLHGPGVYDMKGGLVSAIWTVKAYKDLGSIRESVWNSSSTVTRRREARSLPISSVSLRRTRRRRLCANRVQRTEI